MNFWKKHYYSCSAGWMQLYVSLFRVPSNEIQGDWVQNHQLPSQCKASQHVKTKNWSKMTQLAWLAQWLALTMRPPRLHLHLSGINFKFCLPQETHLNVMSFCGNLSDQGFMLTLTHNKYDQLFGRVWLENFHWLFCTLCNYIFFLFSIDNGWCFSRWWPRWHFAANVEILGSK